MDPMPKLNELKHIHDEHYMDIRCQCGSPEARCIALRRINCCENYNAVPVFERKNQVIDFPKK